VLIVMKQRKLGIGALWKTIVPSYGISRQVKSQRVAQAQRGLSQNKVPGFVKTFSHLVKPNSLKIKGNLSKIKKGIKA